MALYYWGAMFWYEREQKMEKGIERKRERGSCKEKKRETHRAGKAVGRKSLRWIFN